MRYLAQAALSITQWQNGLRVRIRHFAGAANAILSSETDCAAAVS
jgi:hypothetical protein